MHESQYVCKQIGKWVLRLGREERGNNMKPKLAIVIYANGREEKFVYLTVEVDDIKATFVLPNGDIRYVIIRNCDRIDTEG